MRTAGPEPDLDWAAYAHVLGRRLREVRAARKLSQIELALRAGVHPNTVKNIENAKGFGDPPGGPTVLNLYKLARTLGVPPSLLLPSAGEPPLERPQEAAVDFAWSGVVTQVQLAVHGVTADPS